VKEKIQFYEIKEKVPQNAGIYEIWTKSGICLKVGIGVNLRKRLLQHCASRQTGLRLKPNFNEKDRINPNNVLSKNSILAKHLYYDEQLATEYNLDLTKEINRRKFLLENCYIICEKTESKEKARELELNREKSKIIRYVDQVIIRK
jgi:hypothetical protein